MKSRVLGLLVLLGCGEDARSIVLNFPNAELRAATRRIRIEVVDNDVVPRTCAEGFLGTAALGELPASGERRVLDERCAEDDATPCAVDWANGIGLSGLPARDALVYVRGYGSVAEEAPVILEGCASGFGPSASASTNVDLAPVIPDSTRLELRTPAREVLSVGATTPIRVALRADDPAESEGARRSYGLPAMDLEVTVEGDVGGLGEMAAERASLRTGVDGEAATLFRATSTGVARVRVSLTAGVEAEIELTVLAPLSLEARGLIAVPERPVALALRPETRSALVLLCEGEGRCELPDALAENELLGHGELVEVSGLLEEEGTVTTLARGLGRLPVGVVGFEGGAAVLSARSSDCQPVSCPTEGACQCALGDGTPCSCEQSELAVLERGPDDWQVALRHATTASTAATLTLFSESPLRFAVGFRGRIGSAPSCQSPCDCPFGERCLAETGRCEDRDQVVELLSDVGSDRLFDGARCGCALEGVSCRAPVPSPAQCAGVSVSAPFEDECGRLGPWWVPAGPLLTPTRPLDLAVGATRFESEDLVVGGVGRLELIGGQGWQWSHRESRFVNDRVDRLALGQVDPRLDGESEAGRLDVVFWSEARCGTSACPLVREGEDDRGCFGVLNTAGVSDAFSVPVDDPRHCRRRGLDVQAQDGCLVDVDGDGALDAVTVGAKVLLVFRGDGAGGFATPGDRFELEGEAVALACRDLDGDRRSELLVLERDPSGLETVSADLE
ncbi:MAG: VCBS repeat-containing protein [Myxococcota bacterium]